MIIMLFKLYVELLYKCALKVGRRLPIIWAVSGYVLWSLILLVNYALYYELTADYLLLSTLISLGGSYMAFNVGTMGYIADVTTPQTRTMRLSICDSVFSAAYTVGHAVSALVFKAWGYYGSFGGAAVSYVLCILYTVLVLREPEKSKGPRQDSETENGCLSLMSPKRIGDVFDVVLKRRPNRQRHIIFFLAVAILLITFAGSGSLSLTFLFIR